MDNIKNYRCIEPINTVTNLYRIRRKRKRWETGNNNIMRSSATSILHIILIA
jgi:hypothetical protein